MSCVSINVLAISSCMYTCIANRYFNPSRDRSSPNPRKQLFLKKINGRKFCFFCKFLNVCFIYQKPLLSPVLGPVFIYLLYLYYIYLFYYIYIIIYIVKSAISIFLVFIWIFCLKSHCKPQIQITLGVQNHFYHFQDHFEIRRLLELKYQVDLSLCRTKKTKIGGAFNSDNLQVV